MNEQAILNAQWNAANMALATEEARQRPFVLLRPRMFPDGNMWCALYGENLHEGVCGFGSTPDEAARAFDDAWLNERMATADQEVRDA